MKKSDAIFSHFARECDSNVNRGTPANKIIAAYCTWQPVTQKTENTVAVSAALVAAAVTHKITRFNIRSKYNWLTMFGDNQLSNIHRVPKKTATLFFGHDFGKWTPIFTILSLLDSAGNCLQICYGDFHLTLDVLLHYLEKSENPTYSCFKNNAFLFS